MSVLSPTSRMLLTAAVIAWLLSLALPGFSVQPAFYTEDSDQVWYGILILLWGLPFGWLCGGWAVYANVFFVVGSGRLAFGKLPIISVPLMLFFASTLVGFEGVPRDEGTGVTLQVTAWGAGAGFWLASLLLLTSAVIVHIWQPKP